MEADKQETIVKYQFEHKNYEFRFQTSEGVKNLHNFLEDYMGAETNFILFNKGFKIFLYGTILWVLETAFFLFYEGWHITATNPTEIYADKVVRIFWTVGLFLILDVVIDKLVDSFKEISKRFR